VERVYGGCLCNARAVSPASSTASARRSACPVDGYPYASIFGVAFLLGGALGACQIADPSLAIARGAPALAGVLIAGLPIGGIAGGLPYAGFSCRADATTRLLALMIVSTSSRCRYPCGSGAHASLAVKSTADRVIEPVLLILPGRPPSIQSDRVLRDRRADRKGSKPVRVRWRP
jgi:hypothetical protein